MQVWGRSTLALPRARFSGAAVAAAAMLHVLTACTPVEPPRYVDPLARLYNAPASSVPQDVPVKLQEPVGLVTSENGEAYLAYAAAGEEHLRKHILVNEIASKDLDPKFLANEIVAMLKRRFPGIELLDDLASARKAKKKGTILVDMQTTIGQYTGQTTTVQLTVILFDGAQKPVSRIVATGQGVLGYPAWDARVKEASTLALQQLDQKLSAVLR